MLDKSGFHGVPPTTFVEFYHPSFKNGDEQVLENEPSFIKDDENRLSIFEKRVSLLEMK